MSDFRLEMYNNKWDASYVRLRGNQTRRPEKMDQINNTLAAGKCSKCKYTRVYDWSDSGACAAPCENCGAESNQIERESK
jgi:predicted nucleic-acid-binding Zn-ribbon protein